LEKLVVDSWNPKNKQSALGKEETQTEKKKTK
jgi:hypothetical protein